VVSGVTIQGTDGPGTFTAITPEERNLMGSIVADAVANLAIMPNANAVALNPVDYKMI
jgi:hypothetical protein